MNSLASMKRAIGAAAILAGVHCMAPAVRAETVSPDSWVYEALRAFEVRGLVALEPTLPYSYTQCEAYTREIVSNVEARGVALGPRHAFLLDRLVRQFVGMRDRPEDRWSKPVYTTREEERFFAMDFVAGGVLQKKPDRDKGEANGMFLPDFLLGFGHGVTMEASYRLVMAPEWDDNAAGEKPSARQRSYRGLTAEFERAVVDAGGERWNARIGREYAHWGSNASEDLVLSRTAGSLDQLGGRIALGPFALSTVQASLDPGGIRRHLAGHRLTIALPRGVFIGLSETVVYANRDFDFMYFIPLSIFYAQQFNEASNEDNILWALDWKVPLRRGLVLHGQFLVDDIQYERGEEAGPDRLGIYAVADALFMGGGRELELSGGYTGVTMYTYGHADGTQYAAGDGDEAMNPLIGTPLGPDADRGFVRAVLGVSSRSSFAIEGARARYGGGSVPQNGSLLEWYPGMENDAPFPSDPVLRVTYAAASLRYDLDHGSYVSAGAGVRHRDGASGDAGGQDNYGWIEVMLDL